MKTRKAHAAGDLLKLDNQLCFPLYAASRLVTRCYQPLLEPLGLTYPQYIVLMILWEDAPCPVTKIGERAMLASNTLTPLLKRLEQLGHIRRTRLAEDERVVEISLTESGQRLKRDCACIPLSLLGKMEYSAAEAVALRDQLKALIAVLEKATGSGEGDASAE